MNSEYKEIFVWIWLPGETEPVVAGRLTAAGATYVFNYGRSYLQRDNAIAIYDAELPLRQGLLPLLSGLSIPGCLRDAAPDAWGRRVILNKKFGNKASGIDPAELDELSYLIESGSDRIGALDFQLSPTVYEPRNASGAPLEELIEATERVEKGIPLTPELAQALQHGTSIGGARPKALIQSDSRKFIAKFSTSSDLYSVVKAEYVAMRLAELAGLNVAPVSLERAAGKDVLLVERFDRTATANGWQRKSLVSALTMLALDEMMARYASYETLAELVRARFTSAPETLRELFSRIVFNILVGNTDDHARNHAAFWDGHLLTLTPAYDICPQARHGQIATQAMLVKGDDRSSRIATCLAAAPQFLLSEENAVEIIVKQVECIEQNWQTVCEEASMTEVDRNLLWGNQILNPYVFEELESGTLLDLATRFSRG
ncbi:type II toxin-antitoxin system HipA family toxin [Pelobacter propionicus]|uniref:HipA domain protein n=1 Tax=Pelobacter propionicus (strain DSM 2379 / NBRC 103807 / OttBd1) TaxID=338966 RepID=A1AKM8_PELPD|nr:type II toxin-antitoxin system HipA family toxin [Pelobacter propionicus]ABK97898.1 HipA domain protein [Pelobacter propionicus DSM 2379]